MARLVAYAKYPKIKRKNLTARHSHLCERGMPCRREGIRIIQTRLSTRTEKCITITRTVRTASASNQNTV